MIIARRMLFIRTDAAPSPVPVTLFAPQDCGDHWSCTYEIGWPEGVRRFDGKGVDSVQALLIASQMIGIELYTSAHHKNGTLFSAGLEGGYGFPVAANCRDLLVGDDKAMF